MSHYIQLLFPNPNLIVFFLLLLGTILYTYYRIAINMHVKRCRYCTDSTPTGIVCKQSKTKMVKICRIIEWWTAWLLVDLFRTPKVEKEEINGKIHLKIRKHHSGQVGEGVCGTVLIFACVSVILCTYVENFTVGLFLKITPTCFNIGDYEIPAACYPSMLSLNESMTSYRINCTTWNNNLELFTQEMGLLHCFSFYDILKSMAEVVGMFGLQILTAQVTLTIVEKVWRNNKCQNFHNHNHNHGSYDHRLQNASVAIYVAVLYDIFE